MSDAQPEQVPFNLVDAIDKEAPLVLEVRRAHQLVEIANRALSAVGVQLVPSLNSEAIARPAHVESVGIDEVSSLVVGAHLEELNQLEAYLDESYSLPEPFDVETIRQYIGARRAHITRTAARRPEE